MRETDFAHKRPSKSVFIIVYNLETLSLLPTAVTSWTKPVYLLVDGENCQQNVMDKTELNMKIYT